MPVMMTAVTLERRQGLLRTAQVAILQVLPDLVERAGERTVRAGGRALAAALKLGERGVGLLRVGVKLSSCNEISRIT
jgi:hypothetical protein